MKNSLFFVLGLPHYLGATALIALISHMSAAEPDLARQQQYLEDSKKINMSGRGRYPMTTLHDRTWRDWQKRTGELPPDFAIMPSQPFLPDPLVLEHDGTTVPIRTPEQWEQKRQSIKEQFQHWISGTVPPAPDNLKATILEDRMDGGVRSQMIELQFGPDQKGTMRLELLVPPGDDLRPVYMTQWNHRDWAQLAVKRGYIGCIYAGADAKDDTDPYAALYPDYDFSRLMRRAWGASRVVDYLLTRPEVHKDQIAITGHSRNGKQSLWAAAFDDRIGAVITSSCGTGGYMPWRYSDPQYTNETIDAITGVANTWFHPRLRYFFGREDKLPIDQNLLLSVIAPRPLLIHYSHMERQSNAWAAEQCFQSVKTVYDFLDASDNVSMYRRAGEHAVAARDQEYCIDFLDSCFGRRDIPWKTDLLFDYNFEEWAVSHAEDKTSAAEMQPAILKTNFQNSDALADQKKQTLANLAWLLGDEPPGATPTEIGPTVPSRVDWIDSIIGRPEPEGAEVVHIGPYTAMGDHLAGNLYIPEDKDGKNRTAANGKIPVIIYLHQYAYAHGYAFGYSSTGGRGSTKVFQKLVDEGFAVLAIDMFGFGTRLEETRHFYKRIPGWSKMGKMVSDVSDCVDAIQTFEFLDQDRIYILGDTIGGTVGIIAAAIDERIDGIAAMGGFSPWRASNERYESIRVLSHQHGFMPRLGLFADTPQQTPVDFTEILASIVPRPLMIIAPTLNRHSDAEAVAATMNAVKDVYELHQSPQMLRILTPREINRFTPEMQDDVVQFFKSQASGTNENQTADDQLPIFGKPGLDP